MGTKKKGATPAIAACVAAGIPHTVRQFPHADGHFGEDAAHWLGAHHGIGAERIFKTLVVDLRGKRTGLAVAVVPVTGRLDVKATAKALGASKAELADPAAAQRATGYVVYVSGGRRGLDVGLAPEDLARLTGATFADVRG